MFNLFKSPPDADKMVDQLRRCYLNVAVIIYLVDGPYNNIYEVGIFIASIASLKILSFKKVDPYNFADEFNSKWIDFVCSTYNSQFMLNKIFTPSFAIDGHAPNKKQVVTELQEKLPVYCEVFKKILDNPTNSEHVYNTGLFLTEMLFSFATGKPTSQKDNFFKLVQASGPVIEISIEIMKKIKE